VRGVRLRIYLAVVRVAVAAGIASNAGGFTGYAHLIEPHPLGAAAAVFGILLGIDAGGATGGQRAAAQAAVGTVTGRCGDRTNDAARAAIGWIGRRALTARSSEVTIEVASSAAALPGCGAFAMRPAVEVARAARVVGSQRCLAAVAGKLVAIGISSRAHAHATGAGLVLAARLTATAAAGRVRRNVCFATVDLQAVAVGSVERTHAFAGDALDLKPALDRAIAAVLRVDRGIYLTAVDEVLIAVDEPESAGVRARGIVTSRAWASIAA
jgi:hypothetical protein